MKSKINITFFAAIFAFIMSSCNAQNKISADEFEQKMKENNTILVDVRTPQEFAEAHLKGAVNIDIYAPDFATRMNQLDKSNTILLYCQSGNRSGQAASELAESGFAAIYDLKDGIGEWKRKGKPTE